MVDKIGIEIITNVMDDLDFLVNLVSDALKDYYDVYGVKIIKNERMRTNEVQ